MRIGVIAAYPDGDWHAQRFAQAAMQHGLVSIVPPTSFTARIASFGDSEPRWRGSRLLVRGEDVRDYDLFLTPRALGEDGNADFQLELYRILSASGALVVNEVGALLDALDKFKTSWLLERASLSTPQVVVTQDLEEAVHAVHEMKAVVVKPMFGSLGVGVEKIAPAQTDLLAARLARHGVLYLQQFVAGVQQDVRAFVVGDRVAAAVARRAIPGELRANLHLGAQAKAIELDRTVEDLAIRATRALGLDYSGVDLVLTDDGPSVIEVNGTPSFRGILESTGRDMAVPIVEHAVARARLATTWASVGEAAR